MKHLICFFLIATFALGCGHAQDFTQQFPIWKATVKVIDENGKPISNADVAIDYGLPPSPNHQSESLSKSGKTDTNGVYSASGRTTSVNLGFRAVKDGFYKTQSEYGLDSYLNYDPVKWNPNITLTLKKIGKPAPMYVNRVDLAHQNKPALDKALGFDLAAGDWIAPYGKGSKSHLFFTWHMEQDTNVVPNLGTRNSHGWEETLTISFPNTGDGIQEFDTPGRLGNEGSELRSPQEAPQDGYNPQLIKIQSWHPDRPDTNTYDHLHKNYLLRVSTVLDNDGHIKAAQYGKIYGDFDEVFLTFFNPDPNSREIEFDTINNLAKGSGKRGGSVQVLVP